MRLGAVYSPGDVYEGSYSGGGCGAVLSHGVGLGVLCCVARGAPLRSERRLGNGRCIVGG
jgi:hypothetical protein